MDGKGVTGLLYGDNKQFLCQIIGAGICAVWAFGSTFVVFKIVNAVKSMRVSPEVELEGLDVPEFGGLAYPDDVVAAPDPGHGLSHPGIAPGAGQPAQASAG